ncbi:hypothetical protein HHK36_002366 [Tetracentron sinense]|uniref:Adaptor AP-1 19 kDa protein n=1 Tax=Tetracentron sinense TaxID=13715 RepID=A0A835DMS6_TETSI|nr:hypothetical protein HHK36_002366 [Tetracentron sinense]
MAISPSEEAVLHSSVILGKVEVGPAGSDESLEQLAGTKCGSASSHHPHQDRVEAAPRPILSLSPSSKGQRLERSLAEINQKEIFPLGASPHLVERENQVQDVRMSRLKVKDPESALRIPSRVVSVGGLANQESSGTLSKAAVLLNLLPRLSVSGVGHREAVSPVPSELLVQAEPFIEDPSVLRLLKGESPHLVLRSICFVEASSGRGQNSLSLSSAGSGSTPSQGSSPSILILACFAEVTPGMVDKVHSLLQLGELAASNSRGQGTREVGDLLSVPVQGMPKPSSFPIHSLLLSGGERVDMESSFCSYDESFIAILPGHGDQIPLFNKERGESVGPIQLSSTRDLTVNVQIPESVPSESNSQIGHGCQECSPQGVSRQESGGKAVESKSGGKAVESKSGGKAVESKSGGKAVESPRPLEVIRELSGVILTRGPKLCNFVEWRGYKVVYKRYASLYFCMCIDQEDNELEILEIIHHFVEILDRYFGSVCELDLIFNFHKAYYILDELLIAGELQEPSKKTVARLIAAQDSLVETAKEQASSISNMIAQATK